MDPHNPDSDKLQSLRVSRRSVLDRAGSVGIYDCPATRFGRKRARRASDQVNIACIGTGSQGMRVMLEFLAEQDVHVAAVATRTCAALTTPNGATTASAIPSVSSRSPLCRFGRSSLSTDPEIRLTRTTLTGEVFRREPAQKVVEAYYATGRSYGAYRGCAAYNDSESCSTRKPASTVLWYVA